MTEAIINGENFSNLQEFYDEVEAQLTKNLDWKIGRNLSAFNDVLRGGFGLHEYEEPLYLKWINLSKSKMDFGWTATIKYLEDKLKNCHPTNVESVLADLEYAKNKNGQTLYEIILGIISEHEHIQFDKK